MNDKALVSLLDDIAARAWPARENKKLGGWILRATDGITRRANSVYPKSSPSLDIDDAINRVIEFYQSKNLIPRFQVTEASQPPDIDFHLARRGFEMGLRVAIMVAEVNNLLHQETSLKTRIYSTLTEDWVSTYQTSEGYDDTSVKVRKEIMTRTPAPKAFVLCEVDGIPAGVGFGVSEGDWVGIFGLVTHKDYRRRGVATTINRAIGEWAKSNGAKYAYLQAEVLNDPALALYSKIGFKTKYEYWYRDYNK